MMGWQLLPGLPHPRARQPPDLNCHGEVGTVVPRSVSSGRPAIAPPSSPFSGNQLVVEPLGSSRRDAVLFWNVLLRLGANDVTFLETLALLGFRLLSGGSPLHARRSFSQFFPTWVLAGRQPTRFGAGGVWGRTPPFPSSKEHHNDEGSGQGVLWSFLAANVHILDLASVPVLVLLGAYMARFIWTRTFHVDRLKAAAVPQVRSSVGPVGPDNSGDVAQLLVSVGGLGTCCLKWRPGDSRDDLAEMLGRTAEFALCDGYLVLQGKLMETDHQLRQA